MLQDLTSAAVRAGIADEEALAETRNAVIDLRLYTILPLDAQVDLTDHVFDNFDYVSWEKANVGNDVDDVEAENLLFATTGFWNEIEPEDLEDHDTVENWNVIRRRIA